MSKPIEITYIVEPEKQITDLEKCLLILRVVAKNYPMHFDIAIEALQRDFNLPQQQYATPKDNRGGGE